LFAVELLVWRKGVFMHPFCHLLLKAIRVDSPPFDEPYRIEQFLKNRRLETKLSRRELAERLGVCKKTLWNWEVGATKPAKRLWPNIIRVKAV
jgi:DNA-binding XRE family transcriptional regulator